MNFVPIGADGIGTTNTEGIHMARKPLTAVSKHLSNNLDDRNTLIATLVKRMCTFEEAIDYLLSAIPEKDRDDILGELLTWDNNIREMRRIRDEGNR